MVIRGGYIGWTLNDPRVIIKNIGKWPGIKFRKPSSLRRGEIVFLKLNMLCVPGSAVSVESGTFSWGPQQEPVLRK